MKTLKQIAKIIPMAVEGTSNFMYITFRSFKFDCMAQGFKPFEMRPSSR